MNAVKALGEDIKGVVDGVNAESGVDRRWVAIGQTQLQQGLMALTRAIAQPTTF